LQQVLLLFLLLLAFWFPLISAEWAPYNHRREVIYCRLCVFPFFFFILYFFLFRIDRQRVCLVRSTERCKHTAHTAHSNLLYMYTQARFSVCVCVCVV
jgi:hypothetical protein